MGNVIGFNRKEEEPSVSRFECDFALVPDELFVNDPKCPHCESYAHPELIEGIDGKDIITVGDLMMCTDCEHLYLVVEKPVLEVSAPVMTKWNVPDRYFKKQ